MSARPTRKRWLSLGLMALALGLVLNSLLGPLALEVIDYHFSESLINQAIGLDAVALFGAAPLALLAALLVHRSHRAGPVLAFVPAAFSVYMAPQYVVGPEYLTIPGNNEQFFLFHLAIFILSIAVLLVAWSDVDRDWLPPKGIEADRRRSWVMLGVAAFILLGRWLPGIVDLMSGNPSVADYLENPTSYLLIGVLDLGLVVPAALTTAAALRLGADWARTAAYAVVGWFALVPAAVAAMAIVMQVNDDPNIAAGATWVFVVAAVIFTVGAAFLYRPLFVGLVDQEADESRSLTAMGSP